MQETENTQHPRVTCDQRPLTATAKVTKERKELPIARVSKDIGDTKQKTFNCKSFLKTGETFDCKLLKVDEN